MVERQAESVDDAGMTRLDRLEGSMARDEPWGRDDQAWLIAELRQAWARLTEQETFVPVDPSRIG